MKEEQCRAVVRHKQCQLPATGTAAIVLFEEGGQTVQAPMCSKHRAQWMRMHPGLQVDTNGLQRTSNA